MGRSTALKRQFTSSVKKAKKTSTKSYTSASAGGTKSQTEAGKKFVAEKLGLGLGNKANKLKKITTANYHKSNIKKMYDKVIFER